MSHRLHETGTLFILHQTVYASVEANCARIKRQKRMELQAPRGFHPYPNTDAHVHLPCLILQFLSFPFFWRRGAQIRLWLTIIYRSLNNVTIEFTDRIVRRRRAEFIRTHSHTGGKTPEATRRGSARLPQNTLSYTRQAPSKASVTFSPWRLRSSDRYQGRVRGHTLILELPAANQCLPLTGHVTRRSALSMPYVHPPITEITDKRENIL